MASLLWFDRDLRTHDHYPLQWVVNHSEPAAAVTFVPETMGVHRAQFLWESIRSLKIELQKWSIPLYSLRGDPEVLLPTLCKENQVSRVLCTHQPNFRWSKQVEEIRKHGLEVLSLGGSTMLGSLPFPMEKMPEIFTNFRRAVEEKLSVPEPLPTPPAAKNLGLELQFSQENQANPPKLPQPLPFDFRGGENAGRERVRAYFQPGKVSRYKITRNGMIAKDDSTKFSPWLATGSLSARWIYGQLKQFEADHGANESTYWVFFELLWRDYFKFLAQKWGSRFFEEAHKARNDFALTDLWTQGKTDSDFVNAHMNELRLTGWMSNRGRQNVASFLAKTLGGNWNRGMDWFEKHLIDFDIESNRGNWLYLSGQGTDPRNRTFDVNRQAQLYDPEGTYRKLWLR